MERIIVMALKYILLLCLVSELLNIFGRKPRVHHIGACDQVLMAEELV